MLSKAYEIGLLVSRLNGYLAGDESSLDAVDITPGFREAHRISFDFGGYVFARHPAEWARRMETLGAVKASWFATDPTDNCSGSDSWGVQVDLATRSLVWRPQRCDPETGRMEKWSPRLVDPSCKRIDEGLYQAREEWLDICSELLMQCEAAAFPEFLIRYEAARLLINHPDPEPSGGASIFPAGHYSLESRQLFYSIEAGWAPHADWWTEWIDDVESVRETMATLAPRVMRAQTRALVAAINSFEPSRALALSN